MPGAAASLVTAVLAFLDTDAVWGAADPRTLAAKSALRRAVATGVHEENAVDVGDVALRVIDGGLSAASWPQGGEAACLPTHPLSPGPGPRMAHGEWSATPQRA